MLNAGLMATPPKETKEGYELQIECSDFTTTYFFHFKKHS